MRYFHTLALAWLLFAAVAGCGPSQEAAVDLSALQSVSSPGGQVKAELGLTKDGRPFYRVFFAGELLMDTSFLGLEFANATALTNGLKLAEEMRNSFDENWEQPWGEQRLIRNHYEELSVAFEEVAEPRRQMILRFRAYDDGLGFRYELPAQIGEPDSLMVTAELTEYRMTGDHEAWWCPAFQGDRYEYLYEHTPVSQIKRVHTPVTFKTEQGVYFSLHEAALKDYSSIYISGGDDDLTLRAKLVPDEDGKDIKARISLPAKTPWRTIKIGKRPGDLITNYLTLNLNEPNKLGDVSWFEPGKYIGIWWEMHIRKATWSSGPQHGATTANTKKYIDFAAKHGFDGVLVEGWNVGWDGDWVKNGDQFDFTKPHPDYDIKELAQYAQAKGVYLIGHHETGANIENYERQLEDAFQFLQDHGMKAVKTGYVENRDRLSNGKYHHGQYYINHFRRVIEVAAKHQVAIVAHEPIKPTGERRTYPNMISREGARGQEFNAWGSDGGNPPNHQTILPFTRLLAGPMDFTPGVFDIRIPTQPNNQINTTLAKQLALYVTIYSPMQMACDLPEHYEKYPDAFQFIKEVGVDWETTLALDGEIGEFVAIARQERGTGHWFVGAVTNEQPREITLALDFLAPDQAYQARIYRDGNDAHYRDNPESYQIETRTLTAYDTLNLRMAAGGGFAISLIRQ